MRELSLFAGAGGGILGSHLLGWRTVAAVEIEAYRREVLLRRQRDGLLHLFPVWDDVKTFDGKPWKGIVDVVTAGFPCQPFSCAGKRLAADDPRNGWPSTIRIIREVGPRFALLENVPGLLSHEYFGTILGDLAESGYYATWDCFSASGVGAPHQRDRLWILAYSNKISRSQQPRIAQNIGSKVFRRSGEIGISKMANATDDILSRSGDSRSKSYGFADSGCSEDVADAKSEQGRRILKREISSDVGSGNNGRTKTYWWTTEPRLGRVAHGIPNRVDRLEAIGDAQVPAVVVRAFLTLIKRIGG